MEILLAGVGTIEIVHAAAHSAVMFGIILPSRDRLKGSVNYFIIDLLSVQAACFLLHFHALFFCHRSLVSSRGSHRVLGQG